MQWVRSTMMNLDGLEMIAVLVVMGLFIKVLEQFGLFEPVGGEGNALVSSWQSGLLLHCGEQSCRTAKARISVVCECVCVARGSSSAKILQYPLLVPMGPSCGERLGVWLLSATVGFETLSRQSLYCPHPTPSCPHVRCTYSLIDSTAQKRFQVMLVLRLGSET